MSVRGKLLVFEGPDGVGKTTLVKDTGDLLSMRGISYEGLSFPGKDPGTLGYLIDRVHHSAADLDVDQVTPLALQALHVAAHLDTIETRIRPTLNKGITVLLDRTWWSTFVYGHLALVNEAVLLKLIEAEKLFWGDVTPGVVFLVERAFAFRAEHDQEAFDRLSHLYEEIASEQELLYPVVRIHNDLENSKEIIRESLLSVFDDESEHCQG